MKHMVESQSSMALALASALALTLKETASVAVAVAVAVASSVVVFVIIIIIVVIIKSVASRTKFRICVYTLLIVILLAPSKASCKITLGRAHVGKDISAYRKQTDDSCSRDEIRF